MNDQIICPSCKKPIPLTEALSHQLQEKLQKERDDYQRKMDEERNKLIGLYKKRLEEEKQKLNTEHEQQEKELEQKLKEKVAKEMELKLQDTKNEADELHKQNKALQEQLLEMNRLLRQMRTENERKQLELEKKLAEEEDKIREKAKKDADEEYQLKMSEKDKKISDAMKLVDEYKRKMEQGSQQMQGEVLELELENKLRHEFPYDEIKPVAKGERGADILQIVRNQYGKQAGTIIWEFKRTKAWSNGWVSKLKDDQRQIKAELAVIVTQTLPPEIKMFGNVENVWVSEYGCSMGLAHALRSKLIEVAAVKMASVGKNEKMEVLYNYLAGTEFKQRIEAIVESFSSMQEDIEKEKRWFTAKWAKQEKNIRKVIDNTVGMHGDLQSIMGKSLVEVQGLDSLPDEIEVEESEVKDTEVKSLF